MVARAISFGASAAADRRDLSWRKCGVLPPGRRSSTCASSVGRKGDAAAPIANIITAPPTAKRNPARNHLHLTCITQLPVFGTEDARRVRWRFSLLWHQRPAGIGPGTGLITIHVAAVSAVVRRGQEREVSGDAVSRDVHTDHPRGAREEIDAVAGMSLDEIDSTDDANGNVGHIVIGP